MLSVKKLTIAALSIAVGVISANLVYIPIGIAKCFPVQHILNVLLAVLLGTRYSVSAAFSISLLRNLLGMGSLLAFPGSMIGALLAGILYKKTHRVVWAVIGEVFGTGILGSLAAFAIAKYIIGSQIGAFFFVAPFLVSTVGGSIIAYLLFKLPAIQVLHKRIVRN